MSSVLMKSVSGIRGVVGETMTPELITCVAGAFANYVKRGRVVIGRDPRPTGELILNQAASVLALNGCEVIDIGIVPTPTVQLMVEELGAAGGIVISASHNPVEWNAFKLISSDGSFLNSSKIAKFFSMMERPVSSSKWDKVGSVKQDFSAGSIHIHKVLDKIDVRAVKKNKFKVVIDSVNGAGSIITQELLKKLGCQVIPVNCVPDGLFPRGAEPLAENLQELSEAVKKHKAHIGFAQDPDADRLAVVDENGNPLGEETTVVLAVEYLLGKTNGHVAVNLSTTRAVEDVAKSHNASFSRSMVGEINVVELMKKKKSVIGGEGNGGVISPEVHFGRDSLVGIAYILSLLALRRQTVSELAASLPSYVMKKGKVKVDSSLSVQDIYRKIKATFPGETVSELDGLRVDFNLNPDFQGGWIHLRPSNTEPIFRIICEGVNESQCGKIYRYFKGLF